MNDMTYAEMIALIQGLVQDQGSTYKTNVIKATIELLALPQVVRRNFWSSIQKPYTLTLVADTDTYALPYDFDKFVFLKSKYTELTETTQKDFYYHIPDKSTRSSNVINQYFIEEYQGVRVQPSAAETITVTSSSTSDSGKVVLVRGEVNTVDDYEEVTLNASGVGVTTKSFTSLAYISKAVISTGSYTVTGTTSANTYSVIPPEHRTTYYKRLILDSKPTEVYNIVGCYISSIFRPQRDYDVFRVPADLVLMQALYYLMFERRELEKSKLLKDTLDSETNVAINRDQKSLNIESGMELVNSQRGIIQDGHPLF